MRERIVNTLPFIAMAASLLILSGLIIKQDREMRQHAANVELAIAAYEATQRIEQ